MELRNDQRLYSGGAVQFDSSPSVNFYTQLMAKKQAKDEAIDEYYRKLPSTLNSAGMRDQDRAGFDQAVAEWQKHWIQNKDKIRKGNSQEAFDAEQKFRSLQEAIQRSKDAAKTDLELGKMRFSKENGYVFDDPDFLNAQKLHSLPIWDKNHKQLDLGTIVVPPRPFETEDQEKFWGAATKGLSPGKKYDYKSRYINPQTGQVIVPFQKEYSIDQVEQIADRAMALAKNDKSATSYYNKILNSPNSDNFEELQKYYSKVYTGMVDTPEKAAAADAIKRALTPQEKGEEQELNYSQRQQDKRINIFLNNSKSDNVTPIDLREQPDAGDGYKSITSMMGGIKTSVLPDGKSFIAEQVLYNPKTDKVKYIEYVNKDDVGKYGKPAWKEVSLTKFKQDVSTNNPGTDLKFLDRLRGAITGEPAGKTYKVNGYDYTEQEITDAAKQLGMTKEAYMKKYGIK